MLSYIRGVLTGGVFIFVYFVLNASNKPEPTCNMNLKMINENAKQMNTIWGAIETTMNLQELYHNQCQGRDNAISKDIDTLKQKLDDLIIIVENYY